MKKILILLAAICCCGCSSVDTKATSTTETTKIKYYRNDVGKLIEMLPENVAKENEIPSTLNISLMNGEWCVQYADFLGTDVEFCNTELVDALYDMVVKLKAEGVI